MFCICVYAHTFKVHAWDVYTYTGVMLLIAAMLSSVVPLWLVVSPCITGIFLAHHPLRQHLLGEMSSVSGGGPSERTADAMAAKMAAVWGGVAVVPLLLLAPGLRVLVSCALCAGAFACARWRERLLRRLRLPTRRVRLHCYQRLCHEHHQQALSSKASCATARRFIQRNGQQRRRQLCGAVLPPNQS